MKMLLLCSESHYIPNNQSDAVIMDSYSIYYCITKLYVMLKDTLSRSDFFVMAYYTFLFCSKLSNFFVLFIFKI